MKTKLTLFIVLVLANISLGYAKHTTPVHKSPFPFATHPNNQALAAKLKPRLRGQVSKPDNAKNYSWMDTTDLGGYWEPNIDGLGVLIHLNNEIFTYDANGNLINDLVVDTTGVNISLNKYTFDATNHLLTSSSQMWNGSSWDNQTLDTYTYDGQGNQITDITQQGSGSTWTNETQTLDFYSNGKDTLELSKSWNGTGWDNQEQFRSVYDANGNATEEVDEEWNGASWDIDFGLMEAYTYDANNHITSDIIQFNSGSGWMNSAKTIYTVNGSGEWLTATEQEWTGSAWANYAHIYNITWKDFTSELPSSYTQQGFSTGSWQDSLKYSATFDSYGGSVGVTQLMVNNTWVNSDRYSQIYDSHYNYISLIDEIWLSGNWQVDEQDNANYTYSGNNDVLRIVYQNWNDDLEDVVNWNRIDYSNFQYFTVSGVENVSAAKQITVYPNPTTSQINIEVKDAGFTVATVGIFNFIGQNVMETSEVNTASSSISLPVNQLPAGIYFIRLTGKDQSTVTKKFVKD